METSSPDRSPRAYPVPDGRPPWPDGDTIPQPPRPEPPPVSRQQYAYGGLVVALVVAAIVIGVLR
ncbi:hypothetical protein GA0074692_6843 [Micromonospora pallida]|uniref:Uncharacterized protein n=1 Tax=Micromonospora pallida TaxID=145854 RepID=A0A1C6TKS7_9ACTN|nr:hypothetical protein [Micromonospora pallida]SCL42163.1 hypothetical protein GA0074692_6688 [Micromonospora pallida]SCL43361.1 hypothetical protein GA0074692_6843 [Micromonospora pallida]